MPIDPRIAMGFQSPQFEQPINVMGNFLKLKSMQQQNALAEQQMADLERQRSQNAFLNQAYSEAIDPQTGAVDYNKLIGATARGGYGSLAPGLLKSKLQSDEQTAKTRSAELKLFGDALGARRQVLGMIKTPEQFRAWHEGNHTDPVIGPMLARMGIRPEDSRATIDARLEKGELPQLLAESSMSMEEMIKNVKNVDVGGAIVGVTPTGAELWRKTKTLSPDERERLDIERKRELRQEIQDPIKLRREATTLRKEFDALSEVKDFKAALPVLISARNAPDTTAGDIDLAYAVGKIYDPKSVVRESEQKLVYTTGSILQKLIGGTEAALSGDSRFTPEVRQRLLNALNNRVLQFRQAYDQTRKTYEDYATQSGFDPINVVGRHPASAYSQQNNAAPADSGKVDTSNPLLSGKP